MTGVVTPSEPESREPRGPARADARARALTSIVRTLHHHSQDVGAGLDQVVRLVAEAVGVGAASVVTYDDVAAKQAHRSAFGYPDSWNDQLMPSVPDSLRIIAERPDVAVYDVRTMAEPFRAIMERNDLHTLASAKVASGGQFVGMLSALSFGAPHVFDESELEFLGAAAALIGHACNNALLVARLRERESQYREIVESSLDGMLILDRSFHITFANPRICELLGERSESLQGRALLGLVHEGWRSRVRSTFDRVMAGSNERIEIRFARPSGGDMWTMCSLCPRQPDASEPTGLLLLVHDLSELRALEVRAQQVQKLESLAALAGGVAHDFNNLLAGVLGNASLALMDLPASDPTRPYLEEITASARRAADLTKQMLAYSGKGRFKLERVRLSAVVAEELRAQTSVVRVEDRAQEVEVEVDAAQLRQAVGQVLSNAVEALDGHGTVEVELGSEHLDRELLRKMVVDDGLAEGLYAYVEVRDTGPGIDPSVLPRIFDPFFSTRFTGRGLGLAAVLGILRGHRGAIRVSSRPGAGASFRLWLPAVVAREESAGDVAVKEKPVRGAILVADDEPSVRSVAARVLTRAGFEVLTASDGREALEVLEAQQGRITAVLLDLSMPNVGGEKALSQIQARHARLPVVLTSGYDERTVLSGESPPTVDFLQKPWSPAELLAVMKRAIAKAEG